MDRPNAGGDGDAVHEVNASVAGLTFLVHRRRAYGWSMPQACHPDTDVLAYAISGQARYTAEGSTLEAKRGTMLWFPRGVGRWAVADAKSPWSFYALGLRLRPADAASRRVLSGLPRQVCVANATEVSTLFGTLEGSWRAHEPGWRMACGGLALVLLQHFIAAARRRGRPTPHAPAIDRCVERMHDRVGEIESVGALARHAGLSESRFRALFREATGCSVTRYQNRLRVRMARDLLASGQYTVSQVAAEMNFRDVYYFSRLFKRMTGLPPSRCLPT